MSSFSPFKYHAMNPRARMAASLSGLAGFSEGIEERNQQGAVTATRSRTLLLSTLQAPEVGSGLTNHRVRAVPSNDTIDFRDHSMDNLPRHRNQANSNVTPGRPSYVQLRGFSGFGAAQTDTKTRTLYDDQKLAAEQAAAALLDGPNADEKKADTILQEKLAMDRLLAQLPKTEQVQPVPGPVVEKVVYIPQSSSKLPLLVLGAVGVGVVALWWFRK